jgi:hypothetical protein
VSGDAVATAKHRGNPSLWAAWTEQDFHSKLHQLLCKKAKRFPALKDGPYPGGYVVVIYSAEPNLTEGLVGSWLAAFAPPALPTGCSAYLILRYHADQQGNPCFKLV